MKINLRKILTLMCWAFLLSSLSFVTAHAEEDWGYLYSNGCYSLGTTSVVLFPEETFKLHPGNVGVLTYTSSDENVATVDSTGTIQAQAVGTATITASSATYGDVECSVTVVADDGYYMHTKKAEYTYTKSRTSTEYDRFILNVDKGLYVEPGFADLISQTMTNIETVTGCTFYDGTSGNYSQKKFYVNVVNSYLEPCGGSTFINLDPICAVANVYSAEYNTIVHELIHGAYQNTYDSDIGDLLSEGVAEAQADEVIKLMEDIYTGLSGTDDMIYWKTLCDSNGKYIHELTKETEEDVLIHSKDMHYSSYWIVRYILENPNYGRSKLNALITEIVSTNVAGDADKEYEILKANTSENILDEIVDFYNSIDGNSYVYDATKFTKITPRTSLLMKYGSTTLNVAGYTKNLIFKDSIEFDCGDVYSFIGNTIGRKFAGIIVTLKGTGTVVFYDSEGNVLKEDTLSATTSTTYKIKDAVKVTVTNAGETALYVDFGDSTATGVEYEVAPSLPKTVGCSMVLGDTFNLVYYVKLTSDYSDASRSYVLFDVDGTSQKSTYSTTMTQDGETVYGYVCKISAKQMTVVPKATFYYDENKVVELASTSVRDYAKNVISASSSEKVIALANNMLNYGGYSQIYFDYKVDDLANAGIFDATTDPVLNDVTISDNYKIQPSAGNEDLEYYGMSLLSESRTAFRVYFKNINHLTVDEFNNKYDVYLNYNFTYACNVSAIGDDYIVITIPNLSGKILGYTFDLVVEPKDSTTTTKVDVNFSVYSYIKSAMASKNTNLSNMMKALYNLGIACENYSN